MAATSQRPAAAIWTGNQPLPSAVSADFPPQIFPETGSCDTAAKTKQTPNLRYTTQLV